MHLGPRYHEWSHRIVKAIVDHYGHPFFWGKKILDLGCGTGELAGALFRLGGEITVVDARDQHLKLVSQKFPGIKTIRSDLDHNWPFQNQTFDLVLSIDTACHLKNYEQHIKNILSCAKQFVLETSVINSGDVSKELVYQENRLEQTFSYNGFGSIGTAEKIEQIIKGAGASFNRKDEAKLNTDPFQYNWPLKNTLEALPHNRRIWFATASTDAKLVIQSNPSSQIIAPIASIDAAPDNRKIAEVLKPQARTPLRPATTYHRKPTPPRPPPAPSSSPFQLPVPKLTSKVRLFYNYYEDKDPQRKAEIDFCLQKNIENSLFDIIIVSSDDNPTFDFLFQKVNQISGDNDIAIICNSDIYFDGTIALIDRMPPNTIYALSRWNCEPTKPPVLDEKNQDAWIFRGKIEGVSADFRLGMPGCDERLAQEFSNANYTVINPSKSIRAYHHHNSNVRNHSEEDRTTGPYLFVGPSIL
jgi:2-polyprenyl-3-methyl-5-hydroxy-6-metoxy-1,4-benzoquinol methylase